MELLFLLLLCSVTGEATEGADGSCPRPILIAQCENLSLDHLRPVKSFDVSVSYFVVAVFSYDGVQKSETH